MNISYQRSSGERGFSLIELTVVVALGTLLTGTAVLNLKEFNNPLRNATAQFASFVKQVRAEAISSTSAYTLRPVSSTRIITEQGTSCSDPDPVEDSYRVLELTDGAQLVDTDWSICFNSRGFPDGNLELQIRDESMTARDVEILLGGAVRIQ